MSETFAQIMNRKNNQSSKKETIPIICHKCGYFWHYSGKLSRATCPDCAAKVKVAENRQDKVL